MFSALLMWLLLVTLSETKSRCTNWLVDANMSFPWKTTLKAVTHFTCVLSCSPSKPSIHISHLCLPSLKKRGREILLWKLVRACSSCTTMESSWETSVRWAYSWRMFAKTWSTRPLPLGYATCKEPWWWGMMISAVSFSATSDSEHQKSSRANPTISKPILGA